MNQTQNPAQSTLICVLSIFKRQIEIFYAQNWKSIIIKINETQTFLFISFFTRQFKLNVINIYRESKVKVECNLYFTFEFDTAIKCYLSIRAKTRRWKRPWPSCCPRPSLVSECPGPQTPLPCLTSCTCRGSSWGCQARRICSLRRQHCSFLKWVQSLKIDSVLISR